MPKLLALILLTSVVAVPTAQLAAEGKTKTDICHGATVIAFEQRLPQDARRYPFEHGLLKPFIDLWQSGQRPALPATLKRVMVYSVPGHPFLIGYQSEACLVATLAVARERLLQWLGPRIGWSI